MCDPTQIQNQKIIVDYIEARKTEVNISKSSQQLRQNTLKNLSRHTKKNFQDLTRDDIVSFLNSVRKSEIDDPSHKWIGTYNLYLIIVTTFFKWLNDPKLDAKERTKPEILLNLKSLKRKEQSRYKPTDMWSQEDDLLFL